MPRSAFLADWLFFFDQTEDDWFLLDCGFCGAQYEEEWVLRYHIERNHGVMMDTLIGALEEVKRNHPDLWQT